MADVFVSYKRENLSAAERVVRALEADGLAVWWDQLIQPDASWEATIERELSSAKSVIVCWSSASVASENVKAEARRARQEGRLLQVFLEPCEPPLFFGEKQGVNLVDWQGGRDDRRYASLLEGIRAVTSGRPASEAVGYIPPIVGQHWGSLRESDDIDELRRFAEAFPGTSEGYAARQRADALSAEAAEQQARFHTFAGSFRYDEMVLDQFEEKARNAKSYEWAHLSDLYQRQLGEALDSVRTKTAQLRHHYPEWADDYGGKLERRLTIALARLSDGLAEGRAKIADLNRDAFLGGLTKFALAVVIVGAFIGYFAWSTLPSTTPQTEQTPTIASAPSVVQESNRQSASSDSVPDTNGSPPASEDIADQEKPPGVVADTENEAGATQSPLEGNWRGRVRQGLATFEVAVSITGSSGRVEYPGLSCGGAWQIDAGSTSDSWLAHETIPNAGNRCDSEVYVDLTLAQEGDLRVAYHRSPTSRVIASGQLDRSN